MKHLPSLDSMSSDCRDRRSRKIPWPIIHYYIYLFDISLGWFRTVCMREGFTSDMPWRRVQFMALRQIPPSMTCAMLLLPCIHWKKNGSFRAMVVG